MKNIDALERVGIYVPGWHRPRWFQTALMTVTLAKEAGVREIVVTTPPPVNETLTYALRAAVRRRSIRWGGAQAIAALAYGTASIARVQKIFGPGNAFVVEAKRQVVGAVAIDQLPARAKLRWWPMKRRGRFYRRRYAGAGRARRRKPGSFYHLLPKAAYGGREGTGRAGSKAFTRQTSCRGARKGMHPAFGRGCGRGHRHRRGLRTGAPEPRHQGRAPVGGAHPQRRGNFHW